MNGIIPFLDVKIHVQEDGSTKTTVYRKSTHTDQYLNAQSHHPLEHKRSVVRSLVNRAKNIVSSEEDQHQEISHIKRVLAQNNFEPWMLDIPQKKHHQPAGKSAVGGPHGESQRPKLVAIPYCRGLSEKCQRIFRTHGVTTYHKPWNTLRQELVRPKDRIDKFKKCHTVYQISCEQCNSSYVGETARVLKTRFKEHTRKTAPLTAVGEHIRDTGHNITPENIVILDNEESWTRRRIKEALYIKEHRPDLNRDQGVELPPIYDHLVSRDLRSDHVAQATSS